ncbi:extracellular solute-binding protein [Paenarthrobacter ureafaciens]|uniref:extracellular solute-binding protein n=1 Tax=Paenarthrobacter ureafaciens TaxID=37931 RepID=UPI0009ADC45D|nr:extracellular solute-binding protein [Paenarthrobacter ureafaciens]GLU58312.1 ABC transporter substrate-binding protein [Paenarthrobacter ureafaciens]GLU62978.1 ABC transporter substrate-binding protein [Paenarthrobacter ureafaciens]GLU67252.1 ABC transporter substrate-binding protein [Paenarthrobacter ureafaciens]GLU71164.1 ABC transporter substrate-binding protein [Paenarthrobacter ureafaciens]GLU75785.1 ABC transporter substrate-binding protein [Paenarthrobacter ureafaciens]
MNTWKKRAPKTLLALTGVAVLVLAATGCSSGSSDDSGSKITFVGYGNETQEYQLEAFGEPFTEDTGTQVVSDSPVDLAKLKAMVDSGNVTWDNVIMTPAGANQHCGTLLEKLPKEVTDGVTLADGATGTGCSVPFYFSQLMFVANDDTYSGDKPDTIADFFDTKKFPGKRLLPPEFDTGMMELALLADGVDADDLYPLDIDRALAKFDSIRDSLVFAESYGQLGQSMLDGSVDMALTPESRFGYLLRDGGNWSAVWDATVISADQLAVPKGSKNTDQAFEFIKSTLDADRQAKAAELTGRGAVVADANPQFDENQEQAVIFADLDNRGRAIYFDGAWWGENLDQVTKQYTAWQIG